MSESLCSVTIDVNAIKENYRLLATQNKMLMPVVKANAYGHGIVKTSKILQEEGAHHFAVGTVAEAILLRESGIHGMLTPLLGCTKKEDYELSSHHQITTVAHNNQSLEASLAYKTNTVIKLDTGMGRLGFQVSDMEWLIKEFQKTGHKPAMLLSHFSSSDASANEYSNVQAGQMRVAEDILKNTYPDLLSSFGNSATMLAFPEFCGDIPRPGIVLYGGNPFDTTHREDLATQFKPAMHITAPILSVHKLNKGCSISYGRSFTAKRDSMIAWVAMGYADGYRRSSASNDLNGKGGTQIVIHETRCPLIGRINMQMIAVDITDLIEIHDVKIEDTAYILNGCKNGITLEEIAVWWDTISNEVLTTLGKNL